MRSVWALGLLIALYASTNAATVHHVRTRHHVTVRPSQALFPPYVAPNGAPIYSYDSVPVGRRTIHDDPAAYNDPSRFGGAMLPNQ